MKFARDCRSSESKEATAQLLFEALPWIKNLTGKTVVIKYGGAAMVDEQLRRDVMSDIVLLKIIGMRPVIVHVAARPSTRRSATMTSLSSLRTASA